MSRPDVKLTPTHWSPRGEAALVQGGRRTLIWNGIPGEEGLVHIYHQGNNQDFGRMLEPAGRPHPLRRAPPCSRYTLCGGCPWMHLAPEGQQKARLNLLRESLAEHGLAEHAPDAVAPSPDGDLDYRHVIKLVIGRSDEGRLRVGVRGRDGDSVVTIPGCVVATPALRHAMKVFSHHVLQLEIPPYDAARDRGVLRYAVFRQSRFDGTILATLVAGRSDRRLEGLTGALSQDIPTLVGVHLHVNTRPGNAIFDRDEEGEVGTRKLLGRGFLEEQIAGVRMRVGPGDFFQVNPGMADRIVRDVVDAFAPDRDRPVVDLYSGVGAFALALASHHPWVMGVEGIAGAARRARENAQLGKLPAQFVAGDVAALLPEVRERLGGASPVVVVDPARRGLEDGVIDALLGLSPARLAYLSCAPRSLARDLARLKAAGWRIDRVIAYDMFPQTAHVEALALLSPPADPPRARSPQRRLARG